MVEIYCPYCGTKLTQGCDCKMIIAENAAQAKEDYLNSPETHRGWAQQDLIDSYRRER